MSASVTPFNFIEVPTDIIFQVLLCRVRYKLSYRDVAEFFLLRGFQFTHETVQFLGGTISTLILQSRYGGSGRGNVGKIWLVDETYVKVHGQWCYLYRGIDEDGNLVDVRLSKTRDMAGTKAFFAQAIGLHEESPDKVATDGLASYPRAIEEELGKDSRARGAPLHRQSGGAEPSAHQASLLSRLLGFGEFEAAQRFCRAVDEVGNFLRPRSRMAEFVSLSVGVASPAENRRVKFMKGVEELEALFRAA